MGLTPGYLKKWLAGIKTLHRAIYVAQILVYRRQPCRILPTNAEESHVSDQTQLRRKMDTEGSINCCTQQQGT